MKYRSLLIVLLFSVPLGAQTQQPESSPTTPQSPEKEHIVTAAEAKELFQSVDEILQFVTKDTLLPLKRPVNKAMVTREDVEKYVGDKFKNDADRIRLERSELILKKLGLLPRKFQLHDFLIKLLGEQVAGYYDEKTKTMNLLNWVALDVQRPVIAHELTHALQDQSFDLEKRLNRVQEIERRGPDDPEAQVRIDEESTSLTAVTEGQAMIVLLDYILAPAGKNVQTAPGFVDIMQAQMEKSGDSPVFESAPLLLKEELTFPYGAGMKFIRDLLVAGGRELAFTGVFRRMPMTTREIMEPKEYLAGRSIPPLQLPDLGFLKKEYEPFDAGAMGELDVNLLLKQYADKQAADRISPEWRGGAYYAAARRGAKSADPESSSHIGLLYISRWSNPKTAQEFARIYASALPGRYEKTQRQASASLSGREVYSTADGPVIIEQDQNLVIVVESFDQATAEKLIAASRKQPPEHPPAQATSLH